LITGSTVLSDYPGIKGNFSLRLGSMLRLWVWKRGIGAEILSPEGLKNTLDTYMDTNEKEATSSNL